MLESRDYGSECALKERETSLSHSLALPLSSAKIRNLSRMKSPDLRAHPEKEERPSSQTSACSRVEQTSA